MTRRLLLSYLTVTVLVLLLLEIPLAIVFRQRERDRLTADVERDATVLATLYEDALEAGTAPVATPATDYTRDTGARVVVVDRDGISLVDTGATTDRDFSTRPEFAVALRGQRSSGIRYSSTLDQDLLFVAVPVASGGVVHGAVRVTLDTHEVDEQVLRFWFALAAIAAVALATVAAIGWGIARWVTRPIRHLQTTAARFAQGDLTPGPPQDGSPPPELVELEQGLHTMAARLDRLLQQQREFVADASHELRTPLTGMRLRLENLASDLHDPAQVDEVEAAIRETERLAVLVADLLQLARAEKPLPDAVEDLGALTADRVDTWTAMAELEGVVLTSDLPASACPAHTVAGAVEQILDNLIDNAIKAAPLGSGVHVSVRGAADAVVLAIADEGPGLDDDAKALATERFWRGDLSAPGTGLGLAIVQRLVHACGAELTLSDNAPTGLVATVRFRAAPGSS